MDTLERLQKVAAKRALEKTAGVTDSLLEIAGAGYGQGKSLLSHGADAVEYLSNIGRTVGHGAVDVLADASISDAGMGLGAGALAIAAHAALKKQRAGSAIADVASQGMSGLQKAIIGSSIVGAGLGVGLGKLLGNPNK